MAETSAHRNAATPVLLAYAFRPFFLLTGAYGALLIAAWVAFLYAGLPLPLGIAPPAWHAHEMLIGLMPAAIAGFLLTAMCNWTGAAPLRGGGLLALLLLWAAGRLAMWFSASLPLWLVTAVDLAFLPAVAAYVGRVLLRHGNRRNLILSGILAAFALANLAMHLHYLGVWPRGQYVGELIALNLLAVIMIIIGGRITPAFTALAAPAGTRSWRGAPLRAVGPLGHAQCPRHGAGRSGAGCALAGRDGGAAGRPDQRLASAALARLACRR